MSNPPPLYEGCFYHLFTQGNNHEDLFREERNYRYFLQLYARYIPPVAETYAYCLLRNHLHVLICVKGCQNQDLTGFSEPVRSRAIQAFSNLFNAYAKAFNLAYDRTGALFRRPFQRVLITDDDYLRQVIIYIHHNPQKHGLARDFRSWRYSSYPTLTGRSETQLERNKVLELFGGLAAFRTAHETDLSGLEDLTGLETSPAPRAPVASTR